LTEDVQEVAGRVVYHKRANDCHLLQIEISFRNLQPHKKKEKRGKKKDNSSA
jgi:hypothetical protein